MREGALYGSVVRRHNGFVGGCSFWIFAIGFLCLSHDESL